MTVEYTRIFKYGDSGSDIEAVGRTLARLGFGLKFHWFVLQPQKTRRRWGIRKQKALKKFKIKNRLLPNNVYDKKTHEVLSKHFKAREKWLMQQYEPSLEIINWDKLIISMRKLNNKTAGYLFGAGHGINLSELTSFQKYDCSSSVSKVLFDAGLFPYNYAWVSGEFASSYGVPGKGKYFTVYANDGHVWIKLNKTIWWRFDTSPYSYNDKRNGPRLRFIPRLNYGFTARHWPGM